MEKCTMNDHQNDMNAEKLFLFEWLLFNCEKSSENLFTPRTRTMKPYISNEIQFAEEAKTWMNSKKTGILRFDSAQEYQLNDLETMPWHHNSTKS